MKNIGVYARWLKWFSLVAVVPFIVFDLIYSWCLDKVNLCHKEWLTEFAYCEGIVSDAQIWAATLGEMPFWHKVMGFGVDAVSYVLLLWDFVLFIRLLSLYQKGVVFSLPAFDLIRRMSRIAFAWALYAPIKKMILSLVATLHKGVGNRVISISFSSGDVYNIFFVGVLFVVASLMYEGYKLKCDQDLTV